MEVTSNGYDNNYTACLVMAMIIIILYLAMIIIILYLSIMNRLVYNALIS